MSRSHDLRSTLPATPAGEAHVMDRNGKPDRARLVVFDWDGTLVDSPRVIVETLQAAFREAGLECPGEDECRQVIGLGLGEALDALIPQAGPEERERARSIYSRRFQSFAAADMPFFPGAREGLDALRQQGRLLGVATGKSRRGLERMLEEWAIGHLFHSTCCADETASKPDPRMLRGILEECGVAAHEAVLVGDTAFDMEMAHRAGVPSIAVTYGAHGPERMAPWKPLAWAEDFPRVLEHLGSRRLDRAAGESYN